MTVDARCLIATNLGRLLDGSGLSEDHAQETGLITYRGSFVFDGLLTPDRGQVIELAYVRPQAGVGGLVGRFYPRLHAISSTADPFANRTTVEVGCALTLNSDKNDAVAYRALNLPPSWWTDLSPDRQLVVPPTISAAAVIDYCLSAIGITLAPGSLTSPDTFLREEIDLSGGYVSVLNDLLRSALLVGHMTPQGQLLVRSADMSTVDTGPVLTRSNLLSLQGIGGRSGSEKVIVEYDAVEIPGLDPNDTKEVEVDANSDEQKLRDWEKEVVIGPVEEYLIVRFGLTIKYGPGGIESSGPNESRGTQIARVTQTTTTETKYKTFEWTDAEGKKQSQDLAIQRVKTITTGNGSPIGFDTSKFYYPSTGGIPGGGREVTNYTYVVEPDGPRLVREETNTRMTSLSFSSIVPHYGNNGFGSLIQEREVDSAKVIVDYTVDKDAGLTKTVTTRYSSQVKTQSGIIALYGNISNAQNPPQVQEAIDASTNPTKVSVETRINYGREFGLQERPSAQARLADALTGALDDDNSLKNSGTVVTSFGQRTPKTVTTTYSLGGAGADLFSSVTYRVPFSPDDYITALPAPTVGVTNVTLLSGGARARAYEYGRIQNAIAFGHSCGVEITTAPWELPSEPFAMVYVEVSGLSTAFRVHGRNWEIRNGVMVVTADLALVGTAGRLLSTTPVPWVPLTSDPGDLNVLGVPSGSGAILPANTIALPSGFDPDVPGSIWASLPTDGSDVFGPSRTPAAIAPPFTISTTILSISRSAIVVTELLYSVAPVTEEILAISRSKGFVPEPVPTTVLALDAPPPTIEGTSGVVVAPPIVELTLASPAPVIEGTSSPPSGTVAVPVVEIGWFSQDSGLRVLGSVGTGGTIDIVVSDFILAVWGASVTGS